MQLISFFAPKGGAGRTTATMTTASGLIAAGHSVAVIDLTEQARPGWIFGRSFISEWEDSMITTVVSTEKLTTTPTPDHETATKAIERLDSEGFDYVLVDTAKQPNLATTSVMNQSDLVIVPIIRSTHRLRPAMPTRI